MIKVLLVEDMTLTRCGFRALLEDSGEVEVIGETANGRDAIKLAQKLNPEVILMDVSMPGLNGIEAARQIHVPQPHIRILMLSMHTAGQYVFESLRAGASGYVLKDATAKGVYSRREAHSKRRRVFMATPSEALALGLEHASTLGVSHSAC